MRLSTTILLSLLCFATACTSGTPEGTVETFLSRAKNGDITGAKKCLVENERHAIQLTAQNCEGGWTVRKATIKGDRAEVRVDFEDTSRAMNTPFVLREEGGEWRLSMTETLLTMNGFSDQAMQDRTRAMSDDVGAAVEALGEDASPDDIARAMQEAMQQHMAAPR